MAEKISVQPVARLKVPLGLGVSAIALACLAAAWWARPAAAQDDAAAQRTASVGPAASSRGAAPVLPPKASRTPAVGCLIGPERVADIGSPVTAVVTSVHVDRGDLVRRNQPLIVLDGSVEQAGLQAARARAAIEADIGAAEATLALTRQKHERMEGLVGEGFVAKQAVEQSRAERDVAEQKLAQARAQLTVQRREISVVQAQLGLRTLRSPFDGVVVERFTNAGERAEDKPLLRVAKLDPLRVELVLPASRWGSVAKGDALPIVPELPGAVAVSAKVTHIDRMLDAASNTFRVRLALPNPGNRLPGGARCRLEGPADGAAGEPAARSAPAQAMPTATTRPAASPGRPRLKITV